MKRFNSLAWRNIRSRPTRAGLNAIGIILGVGLIFAVTALSSNLVKTFDDLFDSLYGDTDLIVSTENGTGIVPDKTYEKIVATDGVDDATALISSVLVLVRDGKAEKGAKNQIYAAGIEPGAESFGGAKIVSGRNIAGGASETTIDKTFAEAQKFKVGDTMSVAAPSGIHELKVVGITRYKNDFSFGGSGLSQIPLPAARKIFDQPRGYSEVDIKVAGNDLGRIDQIKADLQKNLGDGIDVASPQDKGDQIGDSLKSFNVILGFFAAIAVFVGGFLILNSFSMTIAQRIREIGMLRTMGAGHRQITRSILAESLMLGIVGAILGVLVGLLLTRLLMAMISQFGIPFGDVTYPAKAFILSIGIGILATIVSAWQPARKAGRISPMEAVNEEPATDKPQLGRRVLAGVLVLLIGLAGAYAMVSADDTPPLLVVAGVGGVFAVFTGAILIAPAVIPWIARAMSRPLRVGGRVEGRMAVDSVMANTRRSAATASILMVGIAMVATFGSVASSSIATVKNQLDSQFKSDFTVAPIAQQGGGPQPQFSPKLASQLEQVSGVAVASPERTLWLSKGYQDKDTYVRAIDPATRLQVESPSYVGATPQQAFAGLANGEVVLGESYATKAGLKVGDSITLKGLAGERKVRIAALDSSAAVPASVYLTTSLDTAVELYGLNQDTSLALKLDAGANGAATRKALEAQLRAYPQLQLSSTAEQKKDVEKQQQQGLSFFYALMFVAILIGLFGVMNTMFISVIQRTREVGVLRAIGARRRQIRKMIRRESILLTVAGTVMGLAVGLILGRVFVYGFNKSITGSVYAVPWGILITSAILSVLFGVLAAVLPARRAARTNVVEAVSYE